MASVGAVEQALALTIPANARRIRNLLLGSLFVANHIVHFYQRQALDWVDVPSALEADVGATATLARSLSDWPSSTPAYFSGVKDRLRDLGASGRLGPCWPRVRRGTQPTCCHPLRTCWSSRLPRSVRWPGDQPDQTLLGGKSPHPQAFW
jgi:Ni,Fe-hydrogenase I large subunit